MEERRGNGNKKIQKKRKKTTKNLAKENKTWQKQLVDKNIITIVLL